MDFFEVVENLNISEVRTVYTRADGTLVPGEVATTLHWTTRVDEDMTGLTPLTRPWQFIADAPNQSNDESDFYSLCHGYIRPEEVIADPIQLAQVLEARETLKSFFAALKEIGLRGEI